jgi:hypothetical protein
MNNLTNIILTKVTNLAQTSGVIANVADKLLNRILLEEKAAAAHCRIVSCRNCVNGIAICRRCCGSPPKCYNVRLAC